MTDSIRAVLFDADGVVQRNPEGWLERLTSRLDHDETTAQQVLGELFEAEKPTMVGAGHFADAVASVLARWDKPALVDDVLAFWQDVEADQNVLSVISQLRNTGVRCCLATNQQDVRARYMRHKLGYHQYFDAQFYSCELGVAKPDPAFFHAILNRLELQPRQVLFIDDNPPNIAAAHDTGIHAVVYDLEQGIGQLKTLLADHHLSFQPPGCSEVTLSSSGHIRQESGGGLMSTFTSPVDQKRSRLERA